MLVADPERGHRNGGAPSNTSQQALLDYAWSSSQLVGSLVAAFVA
jgi:hypothetical protein